MLVFRCGIIVDYIYLEIKTTAYIYRRYGE